MSETSPMDPDFSMHAERTPNPNSIKWVLGRPIVEPGVSAHFDVRPPEAVSPLAAKLLDPVSDVLRHVKLAFHFQYGA